MPLYGAATPALRGSLETFFTATDTDSDLLTIAEAAELLKVSTVIKKQPDAVEAGRAFREEVAGQRGGKLLSPSWPLVRKAREERSKQL